jgi:prepilin-type processing-associated H-X9-DG protein/prepilin-type N-terminal cleavage/methylation domain-containing protein
MRSRGLTLIELLVVISLIALLMGLSIPTLRMTRRQSQTTVCLARIRQLTLSLSGYEVRNSTFPRGFQPAGALATSPSYAGIVGLLEPLGQWWIDCSEKVNHKTGEGLEAVICPAKRQEDPRLATDVLCGNYGVNLSICRITSYTMPYRDGFYGMPLSADQVARPSETLLVMDSGYTLISWWHATDEPPVEIPASPMPMLGAMQHTAYVPGMTINRDKMLWTGQTADAIGGRHPGRTVNVGFVDGHVARKKADDLYVAKTGDNEWNCYPLWQPNREAVTATAPPAVR